MRAEPSSMEDLVEFHDQASAEKNDRGAAILMFASLESALEYVIESKLQTGRLRRNTAQICGLPTKARHGAEIENIGERQPARFAVSGRRGGVARGQLILWQPTPSSRPPGVDQSAAIKGPMGPLVHSVEREGPAIAIARPSRAQQQTGTDSLTWLSRGS
jgi:hypothetical protein